MSNIVHSLNFLNMDYGWILFFIGIAIFFGNSGKQYGKGTLCDEHGEPVSGDDATHIKVEGESTIRPIYKSGAGYGYSQSKKTKQCLT